MTSLTDVYEGHAGRVASRRQRLLGRGLFVVGTTMLVGAIAVATTGVGYETFGEIAARELGGTLAGVGLPAVLLGVFSVFPASRRTRIAAVIGASVAVLGVGLFRAAYPLDWVAGAPLLALATTTVYFLGVATILWSLFVALATFKTRDDPGGSARMEITEEGTIRLLEEARSSGGVGGVGLFGTDPDGSVETQTNRPAEPAAPGEGPTSAAVSDGGAASTGLETPSSGSATDQRTATGPSTAQSAGSSTAQSTGPSTARSTDSGSPVDAGDEFGDDGADDEATVDAYCGNCRHFEYVQSDDDPQPYCNYHGQQLDDMDACSAWVDQS